MSSELYIYINTMSFLKEMVVIILNLILSTVDFRVKFLYDRNLWAYALTNTHFWIFLKKKKVFCGKTEN